MELGYCYERFEFNIKVLLNNKGNILWNIMEFIIVLAHNEKDVFIKRLNLAIDYFMGFSVFDRDYLSTDGALYPKKYIIITGGLYNDHSHEDRSKKDFKKYMLLYSKLNEHGIDQRYLLFEEKSVNTEDNITYTHEMIREYFGMHPFFTMHNNHVITFCTSTFHIKRVCVYAKFLIGNLYYMNFLHTHEKVPKHRAEKEDNYIMNFISNHVKKEVNIGE